MNITDQHTIVGLNSAKTKFIEKPAIDFFKTINNFNFIVSGNLQSNGTGLESNMLELYISIAADGNITSTGLVRFNLYKERKKEYISNLLNKLKINFWFTDYSLYCTFY